VTPCEIPYRKDEKYWITSPEAGSASFYIAFNFGNPTDISMARIMLLEFKETTRHVKGSVAITYHDKSIPASLAAAFPNTARETYTNGILEVKLGASHVTSAKGIDQPLTFITGFRLYVSFHLHSMKQ